MIRRNVPLQISRGVFVHGEIIQMHTGAGPDIFIWGDHWRGQFCNKGSCQWSVQDFQKEIWKILGAPGKILGGQWPPWHPPSSAPGCTPSTKV